MKKLTSLSGLLLSSLILSAVTQAEIIQPQQPDPKYGDQLLSPFYLWDQDVPSQAGTLLRHEPLSEGIRIQESDQQYRILFTSTNGLDSQSATVVSGSLFLPKGTPPKGGWPLLVWGHGTVGLADKCAPSWNGRVYRNAYYLSEWLKKGYAVVEPDYQGLGTPGPHLLINVPQLSFNMLDSARAVLKGNFPLANQVIIAGQSQGGAAAFGAASYAERYASDLNVKGTIATGVIYRKKDATTTVLSPVNRFKPNPALAYTVLGFHVLQQYDSSLKTTDVFTEKGAKLVEHARSQCIGDIFSDVAFEQLSQADALLEQPHPRYAALQKLMTDQYSYYPTLKINHPVFIGTGAEDKTPDARSQLQLVKDACAAGTNVQFKLYHGHGHSEAVPRSLQDAQQFAQRVLSNQKIENTCQQNFE